jgi:hypothetical protein
MPQRFWWDFLATHESIYQVLIPGIAEFHNNVVCDSGKARIADKLYTELAPLDARLVVANATTVCDLNCCTIALIGSIGTAGLGGCGCAGANDPSATITARALRDTDPFIVPPNE